MQPSPHNPLTRWSTILAQPWKVPLLTLLVAGPQPTVYQALLQKQQLVAQPQMSWPRRQQSSSLIGALTWNKKMPVQPRKLPLLTLVAWPQVHQPMVHQAPQQRQQVAAQPQRDHYCHRQLLPLVPHRQ